MSTTPITTETLEHASAEALREEITKRLLQIDTARNDLEQAEAWIAGLSDADLEHSHEGARALDAARHAAERIARLRRDVVRLEPAIAAADAREIGSQPARVERARLELVDAANEQHGLPVTLDEAGDTGLARRLWDRAHTALETSDDHEPTNTEVAQRVSDTYATLWMGSGEPTRAERQAAVDGARADADELSWPARPKLDGDKLTAEAALAVIVTDAKLRVHLDPKALEQARTALGLDN